MDKGITILLNTNFYYVPKPRQTAHVPEIENKYHKITKV